jgi:lysophospholipase L1-like esterase
MGPSPPMSLRSKTASLPTRRSGWGDGRSREVLGVIAVNVGVLLVLALAAELIFGQWTTGRPLGRLAVPRNVKKTIAAAPLYRGGTEFVYQRDAFGFRGAGVDLARISILTIGGSTTNQVDLPEEATWQAVLERSLREHGHDRVVVANAGIDGQSTAGLIADLELWFPNVPHLKPHLVVAYVGINDVYVAGPSAAYEAIDKGEQRQRERDGLRHSSLKREIEQRSAFVLLWTTVAGMIEADRARLRHEAKDFAAAQWTDRPAQPIWPAAQLEINLAAYKDRLVRIAELVEGLGEVPVFVTQTRADYRLDGGRLTGIVTVSGPNGVDRGRILARFNAATLEVCRERHVTCFDLATELRFSEGDFYDYEHNTPQGAEKIGRWLAEKLAGLV